MGIERLVDIHWNNLFYELLNAVGDDLTELVIEVEIARDGKTIRRSWRDRNRMLETELIIEDGY